VQRCRNVGAEVQVQVQRCRGGEEVQMCTYEGAEGLSQG